MNLTRSIDLLKLEKAGIATIKNKKCVVIPIEENDLYVSMDENLKAKAVYLGVNINERREPSQYGKTHYCKQSYQDNTEKPTSRKRKPKRRFTSAISNLTSLKILGMRLQRWMLR